MSNTIKGKMEDIKNRTDDDFYMVNQGCSFVAHALHNELDFGEKIIYHFKSPDTLKAHVTELIVSSSNATIKATIKKDITITTQGTEIENACMNLNDDSEIEALSKIYNGNVEYSGGKNWHCVVIYGNETKQSSYYGSLIPGEFSKYITKNNNTSYILEIENICSYENTAKNININLFFNEC